MKSFRLKMRKVATIVACLAVTTAFASCEPADEPSPGAPAFVEFSFASQRGAADVDAKKRTVKAVAECGTNLAALAPAFKLSPEGTTATVDGKPQESGKTANNFADAVVYKLAAPDGTTAEWTVTITLPDDCPTVTTLYSYNPPAGYYIVVKSSGRYSSQKGYAYGNGKYTGIEFTDEGNEITHFQKSPYKHYYSPNWATITSWEDDTWMYLSDASSHIYFIDNIAKNPCYAFNLYLCSLTKYGQEDYEMFPITFDNQIADWEVNLQDYDPTQHKGASVSYLGSEVVNNVDCNVFRGKGNVGQTKTFWVDKNNGLTLKYTESSSTYGESVTYEVITYQLKPDWDALHLHPLAADKVWEQ